MHAIGKVLQVAGLVVTGLGAVSGFDPDVLERTLWTLWGGGALIFIIGTALVRRGT